MNAPNTAARQHTIETEPSEVARLIWKEIESIPERVSWGRPLQALGEAYISHFFSVAFTASLYVEEGRQVRFRASLTSVPGRSQSITLPFTSPLAYEPRAMVRLEAPAVNMDHRLSGRPGGRACRSAAEDSARRCGGPRPEARAGSLRPEGITMTGYQLAVGVLLALGSAAIVVWPRQVWRFARGWRFTNPEAVRLSDAYVAWLRLSGAVGVVLGIGLIVYAVR
jgi:hypothetical protein